MPSVHGEFAAIMADKRQHLKMATQYIEIIIQTLNLGAIYTNQVLQHDRLHISVYNSSLWDQQILNQIIRF